VALFARGHNGLQQAKAEIEAAVSRTGMALAARMA
jgi:hypothetical protein